MHRNRALLAGLVTVLAALAGCGSLRVHWPFGGKAAAMPELVTELAVGLPQQGAPPMVLQYWERNTLIVDLTNVGSQGSVTLGPAPEKAWPARLAFRMAPRRFEQLEVRGLQRVVLQVAAGSAGPVTAELPPGLYDTGTERLAISWGASGGR